MILNPVALANENELSWMLGLSRSLCSTFQGRAVHVPETRTSVEVGGELRNTGTKTVKVAHMEEAGRETVWCVPRNGERTVCMIISVLWS